MRIIHDHRWACIVRGFGGRWIVGLFTFNENGIFQSIEDTYRSYKYKQSAIRYAERNLY